MTQQQVVKHVEAVVRRASRRLDLRHFQEYLQDTGFFELFGRFLQRPIVPQGTRMLPLTERPLECDLLLVRLWSPFAEGEHISGYLLNDSSVFKSLGDKNNWTRLLTLLAKVNFEIIGRDSTLSERLVVHRSNVRSSSSLKVHLVRNSTANFSFRFTSDTNAATATLEFGDALADALMSKTNGESFATMFHDNAIEFLRSGGTPEAYPELARALRRHLVTATGDGLRDARKDGLSAIVDEAFNGLRDNPAAAPLTSLTYLQRAAAFFAPWQAGRTVTLARDFETVLDTLAIIQASVIFAPWYRHATAVMHRLSGKEDRRVCAVCVGRSASDDAAVVQLQRVAEQLLNQASREQDRLHKDEQSKREDLEKTVLGRNTPRRDVIQKWHLGALSTQSMSPDAKKKETELIRKRFRSLKQAIIELQGPLRQKEPRAGLAALLIHLGEISDYQHEGVTCRFVVLFGPGTCWRLFRETVSRESIEDGALGDLSLSHLLESNYSVFQDDDVALFIDQTQFPSAEGISLIARLRERVSEEAFLRSTDKYPGLYALNARGNGRVRLFSHGRRVGDWLHKSAIFEDTSTPADLDEAIALLPEAVRQMVSDTILRINETPGEGTLVVIGPEDELKAHLSPMEIRELQMSWAAIRELRLVDPPLLRALLRRDGAHVLTPEGLMITRQLLFPVAVADGCAKRLPEDVRTFRQLLGRGSRRITAECLRQVISDRCYIVSVSVDGGITVRHGAIESGRQA